MASIPEFVPSRRAVIMTDESGSIVGAGFTGATLVKSQSLFAELDRQPAPRPSVAPRRGLPSSQPRMTTGRMMKALDELDARIKGMARATRAEKVLSHVERIVRPRDSFASRANAGTRASQWGR